MKFLFLLILPVTAAGGVISYDRLPITNDLPWSPGVSGGIPTFSNSVSVMSFGAAADGVTDDSAAFASAVTACTVGGMVTVPAGTYLLNSTISIPSNKGIRGVGDSSRIKSNLVGPAFKCDGSGSSQFFLSASSYRGSTNLAFTNVSSFSVGKWARLENTINNSDYVFGHLEGAGPWQTQFIHMTSITGTNVGIDRPLYWDYDITNSPDVRLSSNIITNAGIESLMIEKVNTNSNNSAVSLIVSANCWISGVTTTNVNGSDIRLQYATRCTVRSNWLQRSSGISSQYGIHLYETSTDNLVENNIVDLHTGPLLCQHGAAGNVIAYNFIPRGRSPDDTTSKFATISHGSFPNFNLYEGNIGAWMTGDNFWGCNHRETLFRNWATGKTVFEDGVAWHGFAVSVNQTNWWWNIVGNILGHPTTNGITELVLGANDNADGLNWANTDTIQATNIFVHGNYGFVSQTTTWSNGISQTLPNSYYLSGKPSWWGSDIPWPSIGPDISLTTSTSITNYSLIPAQQRFTGLPGSIASHPINVNRAFVGSIKAAQ